MVKYSEVDSQIKFARVMTTGYQASTKVKGCGISDSGDPLFALQNPVTFGVLNSNSGGIKFAAMLENGGAIETSGNLDPF